ncbi:MULTISPECIES: hypothetical protein [unclassified Corallococcus]|uniref:hypothetical protein n=1 Tax=unclassified Corallococcus TaxID=2685029 RepID=UPI001A8DE940|nr:MULTISPECIES: hypothetical protein [unclassified Corallococcus]MBN9681796.1 hypothetical protein [Corallococcus sp. NCSPR001]WAS86634.1 hypothetical protein O0N60_06570 [Corallococcus sp. NCRR]
MRAPGRRWLQGNPKSLRRPPAYWRRCNDQLAEAFFERCAYTAMYLGAPGTVDHFISLDEDRRLAYEWTNFRYSAGWLNSRKQALVSARLLDPFEVEDGWFALLLPSLQLQVTERCPPRLRERAAETLRLLGLDHDERVVRYRRQWLEEYEQRRVTLDYLEDKAPLVARAVRDWESREGRQWSAGSNQVKLTRKSRSGTRRKKA